MSEHRAETGAKWQALGSAHQVNKTTQREVVLGTGSLLPIQTCHLFKELFDRKLRSPPVRFAYVYSGLELTLQLLFGIERNPGVSRAFCSAPSQLRVFALVQLALA